MQLKILNEETTTNCNTVPQQAVIANYHTLPRKQFHEHSIPRGKGSSISKPHILSIYCRIPRRST